MKGCCVSAGNIIMTATQQSTLPETCLRRITVIGNRVTQAHRSTSWRQRTRSASLNFRPESLYQALDECQTVLRSWQTIGRHESATNNMIVRNRLFTAKHNFLRVFPCFESVDNCVYRLGKAKFRLLEHFSASLAPILPANLPYEVLQIIWKYSQCSPNPKYVSSAPLPIGDHEGWMAFVELKTITNSVYRAVIRRGFRNSNLDHLRPMIDACLMNIDKLFAEKSR